MTRDQYRREGFQAGIEAAKEACRNIIKNYDVMEPGKPDHYASMKTQRAAKGMVQLAIQEISAIDPAEVLAKAGADPAPNAVARLVEAARWVLNQTCEGFCRDLPSAASYDKEMDIDCGGCRVRAALAAMEDSRD